MIKHKKIYITGIGLVGPCGNSADGFWDGLLSGKSFLLEAPCGDGARLCGLVKGIEPERMFHQKLLRTCARFSVLALTAANEAFHNAGLDKESRDARRTGIFIGNNSGGWERAREGLEAICAGKKPNAYLASNWFPAAAQGHISLNFDVEGHSKTIAAGTCSSHAAIAHAANLIREGILDAALAGGAETPVDPWAMPFYDATGCYGDRPDDYRPFDRRANGAVLGEGAAFLVLESEESVRAREGEAHIRARLGGFGMTFQPQKARFSYGDAVKLAREPGSPAPGVVFAQGGALPQRDETELKALAECFGEAVPVTCPRAAFGHTVGAAGAIDAAIAVMTMEHREIPPVHGLEQPILRHSGLVCGKPFRRGVPSAMLMARGHDGGVAALEIHVPDTEKRSGSFGCI